VNLSLVVVKVRAVPPDDPERPVFDVPPAVPLVGAAITVALIVRFSPGAYLRALGLAMVGAVLYGAHAISRRRARPAEQAEDADVEGD